MNRSVSRYWLFGASLLAALAACSASGQDQTAVDANANDSATEAQQATGPLAAASLVVSAIGEPFRGTLVATTAEPDWAFQFESADGPREVRADQLVTWGQFVDPRDGVQVVLAGGDVLVVQRVKIENEQLVCTRPDNEPLALPIGLVAGLILQPAPDAAKGDRLLSRILSLVGQDDRVILENDDELTGTISTFDGESLQLKSEVGALRLARGKLAAVIFNPILVNKPRPGGLRVLVGLKNGSRLTAISAHSDEGQIAIKLPGGIALDVPIESIVALQPLGGRVVYLSDLEPAGYRHIPFLELAWPYHRDRSVNGTLLRAGGALFLKGLGMHSPSRITYELDQPYERFDADVAVDGQTGQRGSVVFRVFVDDGTGAWQERARSEIVRGGQPPTPLTVDVSGAKRISLLVDFADWGDEQDHADWLNARLVPQ